MQNATTTPGETKYGRYSAKRSAVLRATGKKKHRYRWLRGSTQLITIALLLAVPLTDTARFDILTQQHRALGEPASPLYGLIAVGVAIFSFYFLTFQVNLVAGRMFCGWGCPVGQLNRLWDAVQSAKKQPKVFWTLMLLAFSTALMFGVLLWWITPASLVSPTWAPLAWGGLVLMVFAALLFSKKIGWSFCRKACPIGLYYSVVQQKRPIGILFDRNHCQDEDACVKACPVDLDPKALLHLKNDIGGLAIDGLTENSHCLRCGACVEACELVTSKIGPVALTFGRPERPLPKRGTADLVQLPTRPSHPAPPPEAPLLPELPAESPSDSLQVNRKTVTVAVAAGALLTALLVGVSLSRNASKTATDDAPQPSVEKPQAQAAGYQVAEPGFKRGSIQGQSKRPGPDAVLVYLRSPSPGLDLPQKTPAHRTLSALWQKVHTAHPGGQLLVKNDDAALHTLAISLDGKSMLNVPLPPGGEGRKVRLPNKPGLYALRCASHRQERAELMILDHPYHVYTKEGRFELRDVPVGEHQLEARVFGRTIFSQKVQVTEASALQITLPGTKQTGQL